MKSFCTIILLCSVIITVHAQKFKIKKGDIFIDKAKVATIEKIKGDGEKYYIINDANGSPFSKVKQTSYTSLLYHTDKELPYRLFYDHKLKDSLIISKKNYWLSEKRAIEYLISIGLLNKDGFDASKIEPLTKSSALPDWINDIKQEEAEIIKNIDVKVERNVKSDLRIENSGSKATQSVLDRAVVTKTTFNIYQKDEGENDILIGYGLKEENSVSKVRFYLIYNTKDVPLASYSNSFYKTYHPYKKYDLLETSDILDRRITKADSDIISKMALFLVKENKL